MWNKIYRKIRNLNKKMNYSIGYIIMALGIFILVIYIPSWLWMVLLGLSVIMIGYYINAYFK
ncbi:MAG: hypothetical protein PWQ59_517 [Thermoanaerobacterium sp.]|uniref:hypothetical protein n=1 Tax=Thermoanaerobacterium sp. CMT5567-10 TaxID=3061989 RepID=UPI0024ABF754|nr:hypothetical protein [Thermoanaerobacterium sp. CMT5567-10]MDI3476992.1 hypothetical protein [Thermoanaerobacterium sp.]MDK2806701.1 hypothetical protein [Thermoanaerobacterium sp.]MDN5315988.1 hypothetical protein [Thermoanaerobacterium sp.]WKV09194.1 hypothetical protein Q2T46_01660 [Thermoanaerobacterium sp. CMT5567-10]WLY85432.1 hypothetical protein Q2T46_15525 [Thermoanaerobacterium sp. CMT5567-10]